MLVLASASPRRADTLRHLGLEFEQREAGLVEEIAPGLMPSEAARLLAREKALAVAADVAEGWVLGADTMVVRDNLVVGKPRDAKHALAILEHLQGGTHDVYTGLCVVRQPGAKAFEHVERTEVRFAKLDRALLDAYVATGEPLGKAGAYAIQGIAAAYIEDVRGPVDNVVGLPVRATVRLLAKAGYPLPPHLRVP